MRCSAITRHLCGSAELLQTIDFTSGAVIISLNTSYVREKSVTEKFSDTLKIVNNMHRRYWCNNGIVNLSERLISILRRDGSVNFDWKDLKTYICINWKDTWIKFVNIIQNKLRYIWITKHLTFKICAGVIKWLNSNLKTPL